MQPWSPDSWKAKTALQQPVYASLHAYESVVGALAQLPPLVTSWEVVALEAQLADAARGRRFVLQGGDCAETFEDCTRDHVGNKLRILLQMSLALVHGSGRPIVRIGRMAGQYAKPRSDDRETRDGVSLPSYRGAIVNRPGFTAEEREPDPMLLLRGYERAALTLNFVRSLAKSGFADLHHPEYWDLDWAQHSPMADEFHRLARSVSQSLRFMENILGVRDGTIQDIDFFTSHEGLHLGYEQAQTRTSPYCPGWWNLSTHFPWIGARTADPDGAHVEYFRGIANPIGIKVSAATTPDRLLRLLDILHPDNRPGRLTLIHRLGARKIAEGLPPLIETVKRSGKTVVWICDPMHGNTVTTSTGIKTRRFEDILEELETAFDIHAAAGSILGGVHFELTGENVTECVGGARGLTEEDLLQAYRSQVDPRLNYEQSLEMAMRISRRLSGNQ
jgi:3-deoxy-7-phosphoheptulonate synthase